MNIEKLPKYRAAEKVLEKLPEAELLYSHDESHEVRTAKSVGYSTVFLTAELRGNPMVALIEAKKKDACVNRILKLSDDQVNYFLS